MPRYILLSTLTVEGRQTLHSRPEHLLEVDKELEKMQVKVVEQYAVLGQYDFISIVDAPDNETIAHLSVDLGSRGTVQIMTLPVIAVDRFLETLKSAQQLGRGAPPETQKKK